MKKSITALVAASAFAVAGMTGAYAGEKPVMTEQEVYVSTQGDSIGSGSSIIIPILLLVAVAAVVASSD